MKLKEYIAEVVKAMKNNAVLEADFDIGVTSDMDVNEMAGNRIKFRMINVEEEGD